ncbi:HipA domain-containing protein [Luteibacter sp.]|uniref:HipA domain-containing protein n=1 Tax=Luteibacter sp. TaxID=1886636 RepID=UPI003F81FC3C
MPAISDALTRWGALQASELYRRVADHVGTERSFQRAVKAEPNLVSMGQAKRRAYALSRPDVPPVPIVIRDQAGQDQTVATLVALVAGQWWVALTSGAPAWMRLGEREGMSGVFQGLPWFLEAFRPAGFLGRAWVREHAHAHGWTLDVNAWTEDQVIDAAIQQPWDWRGNVGLERIVETSGEPMPAAARRALYAERARLVLDGVMVGASADGEQPKFTALVDDGVGYPPRSVLVKFSPPIAGDPAAERWGDIMVTEAVAAQMMLLHGISAAPTQVWRHDDRIWLETDRFDRVGWHGHVGMASLRSLAQTFGYTGPQHGWVGAVEHLERRGAVEEEQVKKARRLASIGHLLANTDMHMGNLSFLLAEREKPWLSVAPAYDMTPMRWVPTPSGTVPPLVSEPPPRVDDMDAVLIARDTWDEVSRHELVSPGWSQWAADRAQQLSTRLR